MHRTMPHHMGQNQHHRVLETVQECEAICEFRVLYYTNGRF